MVAMEQTSKPIQSLHRAFEILELLSECPSGMALTVLAQQTGLSKSTTHRFLSSLREMGYVAQDANTGKYRQTLRMFEIGSRSVRALSILEIARPYLHDLMEKTGETVHLVTHEHDKVLYIYKNSYISDVPFNTGSLIGNCSPLYCTGVGKAILANLPASKVEQIWESSSIIQYTKNTIVSLDDPVQAVTGVSTGIYDAASADLPVMKYLCSNSFTDCQVAIEIPTGEQYGIVVSKSNAGLTSAINEALAALKDDGTIESLEVKWFGSAM